MTIELAGIELFGFHGVLEAERTQGQRFLVDLDLTLDGETATAAAASDRIEDAVDYRDVLAELVRVHLGQDPDQVFPGYKAGPPLGLLRTA